MDLYNNIQIEIQKELQQPFLKRNISIQIVSNSWLYTLATILSKSNKTEKEKIQYGLAIYYIQLALTLHDHVSLSKHFETSRENQIRQTTVLAGDYLSGRYYSILASLNDVAFISKISHCIRVINENKVALEMNLFHDETQLKKAVSVLETYILQASCEHFNVKDDMEHYYELLTLKRLEQTLDALTEKPEWKKEKPKVSHLIESIHKEMEHLTRKYKIFSQLEEIC